MTTVGDLMAKLGLDNSEFIKGIDNSKASVGSLDKAFKSFQKVGTAAIAGVGIAAGAVTAAGVGLLKLAVDAAPIQAVSDQFENLAQRVGKTSDETIKLLKAGSSGMVSEIDLMKSYNQAASLVGQEFAEMLPASMEHLGKVAGATGQDMSYMMDSLVKGVGRLSPMILDNLGIQVSLEDATARASEMFGVEAEALTKTQTQMGMMNLVMEKLKANTDGMTDTSLTASAKIARLKATFADAKMEIGSKFLPLLGVVADSLYYNLSDAIYRVGEFFDKNGEKITNTLEGIFQVMSSLFDAGFDSSEFREALSMLIPQETIDGIFNFYYAVQDVFTQIGEFLAPVIAWVGNFVSWKDVLITLGLAMLSVVIPAIGTMIAAIAPLIAVVVGVIAVVAIVRNAWENNWGGIRDKLTEVWGAMQPVLAQVGTWLKDNLPKAITTLKTFWENQLFPALQRVWSWIKANLLPVWESIAKLLGTTVVLAVVLIVGAVKNILIPAFEKLLPHLKTAVTWVGDKLVGAFNGIRSAIDWVTTKLGNFITKLTNIPALPDWLTPGSPTPFEIGLLGIAKAMNKVNHTGLPVFDYAEPMFGSFGINGAVRDEWSDRDENKEISYYDKLTARDIGREVAFALIQSGAIS